MGQVQYMRMIPTFNAENSFTALSVKEESPADVQLKLYPNPVQQQLNVVTTTINEQVLHIYSIDGKQLLNKTFTQSTTVDMANWQNGIYIVYIPDLKKTMKVVKY